MKTIMIVDDSIMIRRTLKILFEKQGYKVIAEAANGEEAIEKYKMFRPDLTTMDITMPVLDGISSLEKIRLLDNQANVIMISALGQEAKIIESIRKGAKHFIVKPFKENEVISRIDSILNSDV